MLIRNVRQRLVSVNKNDIVDKQWLMGLDLDVGRGDICATCLPGLLRAFSALIHNQNVVSEGSRGLSLA